MNFEAFIERCRAQWPEFADPRRLARSIHPTDRSLSHILAEIPGMATENKLRLLNCAVASLAPGEVYVEVGSYKGASLVGAAASNPHARIFACDNFSQFDGASDALRRTLDAHTAVGQVTFHDMDFRDFLASAPWTPARIGAYFYDGGHSFHDQYDGLALAIPHLADDAVVIIDDTNKRAARSANHLVARALAKLRSDSRFTHPAQSLTDMVERHPGVSLSTPPPRRPNKIPNPRLRSKKICLRRYIFRNETPPQSPPPSKRTRTKHLTPPQSKWLATNSPAAINLPTKLRTGTKSRIFSYYWVQGLPLPKEA